MFISKILGAQVIDMGGMSVGLVTGWQMQPHGSATQLDCLTIQPLTPCTGVCCLPFAEIIGMSEDAVIINNAANAVCTNEAREVLEGFGAQVITPSGDLLGAVADMRIDDRGRIAGLLLDCGDMVSAKRVIAFGNVFIVSKPESLFPFDMWAATKTAQTHGRTVVIKPADV